jgi:hypothetical protein
VLHATFQKSGSSMAGLSGKRSGDGKLNCSNCGDPYEPSEARVQRSLKQFFGTSRAKRSTVTPKLCWVCTRLYYAAQAGDALDEIWRPSE